MKRHFLRAGLVLFTLTTVVCVLAWGLSYRVGLSFVWADQAVHTQLVSNCGSLSLVQNTDWWRKEPLAIVYDLNPSSVPVTEWPGTRVASQAECCGFRRATGEWVSPFMCVPAGAEFTGRDRHLTAGMMHYTITPMTAFTIPYWSVTLLSAMCLGGTLATRRRSSRCTKAVEEDGRVQCM